MNSKDSVALSLITKVCIITAAAFLPGLFFGSNMLAYAKGLALGGVFTILKVFLMQSTFSKAVQKPELSAKRYATIHFALRHFLTFVILIIGALEPTINIIGVIIGLLSLKLAAYWHGHKTAETPKDGSVEFLEWEDEEDDGKDFHL